MKMITENVDWGLKTSVEAFDIRQVLHKHKPDILCFQEGKHIHVAEAVKQANKENDTDYRVLQYTRDESHAGSGIIYNNKTVAPAKTEGFVFGTAGRGVLPRYLVFKNFRDRKSGKRFRVVALHLPPKRVWNLYPRMIKAVIRLAAKSKLPTIFVADWNKLVLHSPDLKNLANKVHGSFHGVGIDGFLVIGKGVLRAGNAEDLAPTHSDHKPVSVTIS